MIAKTRRKMNEFSWQQEDKKNTFLKKVLRYIVYMAVLLFIITTLSPVYQVKAAALSLKIDGVSNQYTGKQVYVTYNSNNVKMKNTPGIVLNGTSYVSYKNVFGDSKIGAKVSYNSKEKTVTITKYDTTIVMTLGSKTALVNGTKVNMTGAPIKVTYTDKKVTKILVPTEFVAKTLGYEYSWYADATTVTAEIKDGLVLKYDNKTTVYRGIQTDVSVEDVNIDVNALPGLIIDDTLLIQAKKVFASKAFGAKYKYDKATKSVTLTKDDIVIQMKLESNEVEVNDEKFTMPTAVRMVKNVLTGKSYVCVPAEFIATTFGYQYDWDKATNTCSIYEEVDIEEDDSDTSNDSNGSDSNGDVNGDDNTNTDSNGSNNNGNGSTNPDSTIPDSSTPDSVQKKVLAKYQILNQYYDTYQALSSLQDFKIENTTTGETGYATSVTKAVSSGIDREVYTIQSLKPFTNISTSRNDNQIKISATNMIGTDAYYSFYTDFVTYVQSTYDYVSTAVDFTFVLTDNKLSYDVSLSSDMCTLTITIYANYIEEVEVGVNEKGEYVQVKSLKSIDPSIVENDDSLILVVPNTINSIESFQFTSTELTKIISVNNSVSNTNDMMFFINRASKANYTIEQGNPNIYTIYFPTGPSDAGSGSNGNGSANNGNVNNGNTSTGATATDLQYSAVTFPMPTGIDISQIKNEDLYLDKQIKIYIPGNHTSSINSNTITKSSSFITSIDSSYSNNQTVITLTTSRICGFDYKVIDGYFCMAIDRPSKVYDKIVVLDPGHGGSDTGARAQGVNEKDINYKILYTYGKSLFEMAGIKVYYTRTDDSTLVLKERPLFSETVEADLFISLHMNSATTNAAKGTEVFYYSKETGSMNGLTGKIMAQTLSNNLSNIMDTTNRGAKASANLVVLKYNTVPSVLIELGFMSNSSDFNKITSETYQRRAAESISATILEFFEDYPTGR